MNKEADIKGLECAHREIINRLDQVQQPQNWKTNPDKVEASLSLTVEEAIILAEIARLKRSFPHITAALYCLHETRGFADQRVAVDISKQAMAASLGYPKYIDAGADKDSDLGKIDAPFNRFATFLQSAGTIARIRLGMG